MVQSFRIEQTFSVIQPLQKKTYYLAAGRATKRDEDAAILWYKRAVRQSYSLAAVNIACVYNDRQDQRRAFFWYQRAAAMDDGDALVEVGVRFYEGRGVARNAKRAVNCFREAIQSGSFSACKGRSARLGAKWQCLGLAGPIAKAVA